ncbi:hypothetical protein BDR03DRAFT_1019690 [Suillus americanus]|nr:hypothetical protein BDR03DRAFT_1019690 [Suillus americanus]
MPIRWASTPALMLSSTRTCLRCPVTAHHHQYGPPDFAIQPPNVHKAEGLGPCEVLTLPINELQALCHEHGLNARGRTADLIERLAAAAVPPNTVPPITTPTIPEASSPPSVLFPAVNSRVPAGHPPIHPQACAPGPGDDVYLVASHDASQLARSFQGAYNGSDGGIMDDDMDDDGTHMAGNVQDD